MKGRFAFLIWITTLFAACSANQALPKETALFPDAYTEKWWIINTISQDGNGQDVHFSALIRFAPAHDRYFTHFFTSLWVAADSTYYAGTQSSEASFYPKKDKFPIKLTVPGKDSTARQWSWKLDRKSMRLQSVVQNATDRELLPLKMKIKLRQEAAFNLLETKGEITVQHLPPSVLDLHLSGAWHIASPAVLNVHVIKAGEKLLAGSKRSVISWLDISLDQGGQISLLYATDPQGNIQILNQAFWQHQQLVPAITLLLRTDQYSGPDTFYPLRLWIEIPEKNMALFITPRREAQFIGGRKNSLWMGAVQAIHSTTGAPLGKGNLYVLKQ